ncbi:hypothetical protein STEG23_012510 [Scotinomys teguina]
MKARCRSYRQDLTVQPREALNPVFLSQPLVLMGFQIQHELPEDEKPAKTATKQLCLEPYLPNGEVLSGMPVSTAVILHALKNG